MRLIKPSFKIEDILDGVSILKKIEEAGRKCYQSSHKITEISYLEFVQMIIKNGHESVLEHEKITVTIVCDRGVSHEIVRHRIASYSQESTRFCNYSKDEHINFIIPCWIDDLEEGEYLYHGDGDNDTNLEWFNSMIDAETSYNYLINHGWQPQQAHSVLPNSLKTEITMTANLREWRTIFKQRTAKAAHPQMREIMIPLLQELKMRIPIVFDDILI